MFNTAVDSQVQSISVSVTEYYAGQYEDQYAITIKTNGSALP